ILGDGFAINVPQILYNLRTSLFLQVSLRNTIPSFRPWDHHLPDWR
ncbi:hypothetical protein LCGC14_2821060, partial [marine sediment metagenome]